MSKHKKAINPFYVLLVLAGLAFLVTASTYGVMSYRAIDSVRADAREQHGLMDWIDANGMLLMLVEVGLIALFTVAAMATDNYWEKISRDKSATQHKKGEPHESATHGAS